MVCSESSVPVSAAYSLSIEKFPPIILLSSSCIWMQMLCFVILSSEKAIFQADHFNPGIDVKWQQPSRPV